jgi:2-amino-4-hydroxy-6-hydroxymethyldihydropteridine diphosphokinase
VNEPLVVAIALGSNLDDRYELLESALASLRQIDGVRLLRWSSFDETVAIGPTQPTYLNQMALLESDLSLAALLSALQLIEAEHGRTREVAKGPRTLDLDIVWARGVTVSMPELMVPHPGLISRQFWHRELAELIGLSEAADAIASAQIHAGRDTAASRRQMHERRWSGNWEIVTE